MILWFNKIVSEVQVALHWFFKSHSTCNFDFLLGEFDRENASSLTLCWAWVGRTLGYYLFLSENFNISGCELEDFIWPTNFNFCFGSFYDWLAACFWPTVIRFCPTFRHL